MRETEIWMHFFIEKKINEDVNWKKCKKIIYSGSDVPGEGEHKIITFIRGEKARAMQKKNNSNSNQNVEEFSESTQESHVIYSNGLQIYFLTFFCLKIVNFYFFFQMLM